MSHIKNNRTLSSLILLLASLFLSQLPVNAQSTTGLITGSVADSSGAALKGAQVELLPSTITAVTDEQGEFTLPGVAAGHYTLAVSNVGFKPYRRDVDLAAGQTANLEVKLDVESKGEEILVTAERAHGEVDAINETRAADNILQVLPAEVIMSLPNANVADAIGRFPSVTLYRIEGEGVYIQVRGTEPRLTNVTVDGVTIPAPEPTVRQVRLDVIPSDMVDAIEMNKTLSANMDGNGIGGSVNLRTKTAAEEPYINLFTDGGYTPILNGRAAEDSAATYSRRFGKTKKFGVLLDGSYDYNGRGIDNIQPALDPYSTFAAPFYDDDTIREYRYYRYRIGIDGSADYKLSDSTSLFATGLYTDLKDWGDKWYYEPVSNPLTSTGSAVSTKLEAPKFYTSSKRPNASVGSVILGARHFEKSSWYTVTLSASRSYEVDSAGNPKSDFSWNAAKLNCNYNPANQTDVYRPTFGVCDGVGSPLLNAADWSFKDITISKGLTAALDLTGALSYARNYMTRGHFGTFEVGFKFANNHQSQDSTEIVYDNTGATLPNETMAQLQSGFENTDYFNGTYFGGKFGPVSDFYKVQNWVQSPLSSGGLGGATGPYVDGYKTASDTYPNLFHYVEQIPAWYAMNTLQLGKFHVQTGLRFEYTRMNTFGYEVTLYAPGATQCSGAAVGNTITGCGIPTGINNNPSYLDVLPSLQIRYSLGQDSDLRAVVARGVARPDPYQIVPYVTEDDDGDTVAVGNPSLGPEHAVNYDLLYEKFLHPLGIIQAGFFAKQLSAPQFEIQTPLGVNVASLPAGSLPISPSLLSTIETDQAQIGAPSTVTVFVNGQNALLYGFEMALQQHMSYLPGVMSGLGISANYSYTASHVNGLPLRVDQPRLIDQATNTWNFGPTYDTNRFSLRMGVAFNGASLFSYNWFSPTLTPGVNPDLSGLGPTGPSGDVWTLPHLQVDAQASYRLWRGLGVMVSGLNLTNEVFGYYTGSTQFVNQREYYKPTYTGGLRYTFAHRD